MSLFVPEMLSPMLARTIDPQRPPVIEVVDPAMAAVLRRKTGAERLKIANDMFVGARRILLGYLRAQHPQWDERQLEQEAARRISHRTQ
jgi:Rv0078B-related antitoxin